MQTFELGIDGVLLHHGDNRDVLKSLPDASIDSVVTDPPYALNFMGKGWDSGAIAHDVAFWAEVLRVLKPGGHVVAFSGTRTYHRMVCAIEDAGFEIRDSLMWVYGTGFPKSHNIGNGWGTALKPSHEPIVLARKPLSEGTVAANVLRWGTGAINVDGCRVGTTVETWPKSRSYAPGQKQPGHSGETQSTGEAPAGRWPANLVHDGSDEVVGMFPSTKSGMLSPHHKDGGKTVNVYGEFAGRAIKQDFGGDSGSAARFFYSAKASKADRAGSKHPTVKPIALMQWLARLITPPGGTILDPFAGSGTTGAAAIREGFNCILCERENEYADDIKRRFAPTPFELTA